MPKSLSCPFCLHIKLNVYAPTTVTISRIDFRLTSWIRSLETSQVKDKMHHPVQIKTNFHLVYAYFYVLLHIVISTSETHTDSFGNWKPCYLHSTAFLPSFKTTTTTQNSFSKKITAFFGSNLVITIIGPVTAAVATGFLLHVDLHELSCLTLCVSCCAYSQGSNREHLKC